MNLPSHPLRRLTVSVLLLQAACGGRAVDPPPPLVSNSPAPTEPTTLASLQAALAQADQSHAYFTAPAFGQLGTGTRVTFQWTAVSGAIGYQLQVGTTSGGSEIFDTGPTTALSAEVSGLPPSGVVFARVRGLVADSDVQPPAGRWPLGSAIAFRADAGVSGADFVQPAAGADAAPDQPIIWTLDPIALSYRLRVGTLPGRGDIDQSGQINVDRRLVAYPSQLVAPGETVYATLETIYLTGTATHLLQFRAPVGAPSTADRIAVAQTLAAQIRGSADLDNEPVEGSLLERVADLALAGSVTCTEFTKALVQALTESNVRLPTRSLAACFNPNLFDCHELVEILEPETGRWQTLDPTFGIVALRADGIAATAAEISAAARTQDWSAIRYRSLTPAGDAYARAYYIDYPLLFLDLFNVERTAFLAPAVTDLSPFLADAGLSVQNAWGSYAFECAAGAAQVTVEQDGSAQVYDCATGSRLSRITLASTMSGVAGDQSLARIWRLRRAVF